MYERTVWIDDDGSLTVGTAFNATRMNNIETGISAAHLGYDAVSNNNAEGTGTLSWTHTPVTAVPRGVLVFVLQDAAGGAAADQVTAVTYGGIAMREVPSSPFVKTAGGADGVLHAFFLGVGVPAGAQTVSVTVSGSNKKRAVAITLRGPLDLRVEGVKTAETAAAGNLEGSVLTAQETTTFALFDCELGSPEAGIGMTSIYSANINSLVGMLVARKIANGSGGSQLTRVDTGGTPSIALLAVSVGAVRDFGLVTALPTIAGYGDTCRYVADKTNGIIWTLIYDGEGEYPWKKIGGSTLRAEDTEERKTTSETPQTTGAPSVTAPLKGDYRVSWGCKTAQPGTVNDTGCAVRLFRAGSFLSGAEAKSRDDSTDRGNVIFANQDALATAASSAFQARYYTEFAAREAKFKRLFVEIDPIRVG